MKIGIIGAGKIGGALAIRLVALGHDVVISNSRGPQTLDDVARETGATPVANVEAARGRELVIVTIEQYRVPELAAVDPFAGVGDDVVVIETNNYYPQQRDGRIEPIEAGMTESRWVAQQLGRPALVKAFNGIYSEHLKTHGRPAGDPERIALPLAGDDETASAAAAALIDSLGFEPVADGGLDDSWRQQPGTPVYGADLTADAARRALAEARPRRPLEFTATS